MSVHALHKLLVGTPSVSGDEARLAGRFTAWLTHQGMDVERAGNNLWFTLGKGVPRLLVNSHLDTVPPAAGWTRDPFVPSTEGDKLYGLGANDAKGCVAAMSAAALTLAPQAERLDGQVVFAFTAEEETGGAGLATILDQLGPLDAAIVGEPTGLDACTAQRGMLLLRCNASGKTGHSAHGRAQDNAIYTAARDIAKLESWTFAPHPQLGAAQAQVTQINGGLKRNQIPASCEFFVDIRTTPNFAHMDLIEQLRCELQSEVNVYSARYEPKATPPDAAIVKAALSAGAGGPIASSTASDWAFLPQMPVVKIGPGETQRSHSADEYLTYSELKAGVNLYTQMIKTFFQEANHEQAA